MQNKHKDPCLTCGFWDSDYECCTCPSSDMWYACPMSDPQPEDFEEVQHEKQTAH